MRVFAAAVLLVAAAGVARAAAPVYDCPEGGFAFEQPPGWTTAKEKDEALPTLSGPKADLRAPYVVIHAVKDARDLFTFADAAMKEKLKNFHFQLTRRDAFQTADKDFGVKFVFTFNATGDKPDEVMTYKQAYYLV
ncbi:MAG TPA: hypothetical protein VHC95_07875, partial [Opitutales bacterium]|nr:hypothetical protein [Opitutales bacterium]